MFTGDANTNLVMDDPSEFTGILSTTGSIGGDFFYK
jgi:hypothetical protein